jgi:HK97 family phage major capsid protein
VKLTEKKLTALVPVSNDLLKNSNIQVDRLIRDDMVRAAANAEDIAFLKGDGFAGKPKGIYYWIGAAGRGNSAGTSLANSRTDVSTALNRLGNNNAPMVKRAWFMHSRTMNYAGWQLVDANGNFAYPTLQEAEKARLAGAPVFQDNNISIVLGGGTASETYYAEMSECFIGDSGALELELFANATYADPTGTLRSGISRDESVVRLIRKTDFAMRHIESAYVLENVLWI